MIQHMSIAITSSRVRVASWRFLISIAFCLMPSTAGAADKLWDNVDGGIFSEPNNWFGGVPGTNDVARFETTNSNFFQRAYTVDFTHRPHQSAAGGGR